MYATYKKISIVIRDLLLFFYQRLTDYVNKQIIAMLDTSQRRKYQPMLNLQEIDLVFFIEPVNL